MNARFASCSVLALLLFACGGATTTSDPDDRGDGLASHGSSDEPAAKDDEAAPAASDPVVGTACAHGDTQDCERDGETGTRACAANSKWDQCTTFGNCRPGDHKDCSVGHGLTTGCMLDEHTHTWNWDESPCNTPLVLAFHREAVTFTHPSGSFDLVGASASHDTDWVSAATPWLALDVDGNGRIDDGTELFGSMTRLPDGTRARQGFEALAALDDDHDGRITAHDAAFARLVVWRDADQDRASSPRELSAASSEGLVAIELGYRVDRRCTGTACEVERASFTFQTPSGRQEGDVIDVHFAMR